MRAYLTYSAYVELNEKHPAFASALEPRPRMRVRILMAAKVPTGARSLVNPGNKRIIRIFDSNHFQMNRLFLLLFGAVSLVAHAQVPDYVPTEGLVAWYPFNGNANDESGNGNHGEEYGTSYVDDRFNGSAMAIACGEPQFATWVQLPTELETTALDFTFSFWIQPWSIDGRSELISRDDNAPQAGGDWSIYITDGVLNFETRIGNEPTNFVVGGNVEANAWSHVVINRNASQGENLIFLNGAIVAAAAEPFGALSPTNPIHIGRHAVLESLFFRGDFDDFGFWNRALTEEEILALYNAEPPVSGCTDPTACNFDAEANEDDGSCLSTLELSLQNQIQISSEGELVLTAPETLQNWTWDNGTSDSSIPIGSGGTFSIQGVIGVIPEIGSELNEGLIFDIDSLNQIVYIASPEEIGTGSEWGCYGTSTGASGQGMGDGITNTQLILEHCTDENSAAAVASNYGENWYLPSFEELDAIRTQLHNNGFGDYSMDNPLSFNWYWSSTECSENPDWAAGSMLFSDGFYGACNNKDSNPGGVIAAKMVQGDFCLFTDTITIEVDCSESNDLSANGTSCGPGTYWDELESLCLPIENCQDDLDGDGVIGVNDLMQLLSSFGTDCAPTEEPETAEFTCGDPVSYHGYDYTTVQIGEQCWFAENFRTEHYANGDAIPANLSYGEWGSTTSGAVAVYGEDAGCDDFSPDGDACDSAWSLNEYGRLYNWYTVDDDRELCPTGWHVPTDGEWMTLEMELGMSESEANSEGWRGTDQGLQMKTTYGWFSGGNGSNSSGFSGLPGGSRNTDGNFYFAGYYARWWSCTSSGSGAWTRGFDHNRYDFRRNVKHSRYGFSVRCIKD